MTDPTAPTAPTVSTALICPKCGGTMRSYERNGVTIDQCQDCRGVFLDRGELERLIDAEERRYSDPPPDSGYADRPGSGGYDQGHGSKHGSSSSKKRRGFLGELFD